MRKLYGIKGEDGKIHSILTLLYVHTGVNLLKQLNKTNIVTKPRHSKKNSGGQKV